MAHPLYIRARPALLDAAQALDAHRDALVFVGAQGLAGPGALLVAKIYKTADWVGHRDRIRDKDALDVLRLLRCVATEDLADRLAMLRRADPSSAATNDVVGLLPDLFGQAESPRVAIAVSPGKAKPQPRSLVQSSRWSRTCLPLLAQ